MTKQFQRRERADSFLKAQEQIDLKPARAIKPKKDKPAYQPELIVLPVAATLALDLGTALGFALVCKDGKIKHGAREFSPKNGRGQRWESFRIWLAETIHENGIQHIAYEDVKRHSGTIAAHVYGGFLAVVEMIADRYSVTMHAYGVGAIKSNWAGDGRADKETMVKMALARGLKTRDDNTADALAILNLHGKTHG